jgi:hypothetical protein
VGRVTGRAWLAAGVVAAGGAAFLAVYLAVVTHQGNDPLPWVIAVIVIGGALPLLGCAVPAAAPVCFAASALMLTGMTLLAAFSIGLLLLPFAIVAWLGFAWSLPTGKGEPS